MKQEILSTKDLREVIGKFLMFIAVEVCKSKHTVNAYRRDIDDFVTSLSDSYQEHVSISTLESLDIKSIRKWIQSRSLRAVSARSNIRAISAIRAFFKYLNENKIVHNNIIFDFKKPKVSHLLPRAIDHSDVMQLIQVAASMAKHHWQQKRDKAILLLMFSAGLRIEEALSITVSDAIERNFMYVNGKSNKQRLVPILSTVQSAILDYYNAAPFTLVGSDYLFVGNSCQKYGARAIQKKIAIARRILNLPDSVTPHTLRHSCATILLNSSNDIVKVKNLLGHSRLSTTQIYTKVTPQRIANELQRIDFWQ